jgi:hypothetical protein
MQAQNLCKAGSGKPYQRKKGQPKECVRTLFEHVENDENVSDMS